MPDIERGGSFRWSDPGTSKDAAESIKVSRIQWYILGYLKGLDEPRNGWEMSKALGMPTITVVPRLAKLRRWGFIVQQGVRPGPSLRSQIAYVITHKGKLLASLGPDV